MKASIVTKDRNTCPTSGAGKTYSVGCLPLLLVWFLVDLIGKAIIFGIASFFGKPLPSLAMVIKWTACAIFIPLGAIFIATLMWILYVYISERTSNIFRRGPKDKGRLPEVEQKALTEECNERTNK